MKYVKTVLIVLTLGLSTIFNFSAKPAEDVRVSFHGKKLVIALDTNYYNYFVQKGYPMGYQVELLDQFADHMQLDFEVRVGSDEDRIKMLQDGQVDMVVFSEGFDSLYTLMMTHDDIMSSIPLDDHIKSVWLTRSDKSGLNYAINSWVCNFKDTKLYSFLQVKYFERTYSKSKNQISEFDYLLKKYSPQLEWDWRLLAALVHQESMFQADARSKHGAAGLMQLMPITAKHFGIVDINDPEDNIRVGVKLLSHLKKSFDRDSIPNEEKVKFILASYNAGEGRIEDCRAVARFQGLDPNNWQDVRSVIPMMKEPSKEIVSHMPRGKFNGAETMVFVENIMGRYKHYQQLVSVKN